MTAATNVTAQRTQGELAIYSPAEGLKAIAVAEAAEKHFARAKDATQLLKAIEAKLRAQAKYVVWRDGVVVPSRERGSSGVKGRRISAPKSDLPAADPGDVTAHRWRKRLCKKVPNGTVADDAKIEKVARKFVTVMDDLLLNEALEEAVHRCQRVVEFENVTTIRGTEGTGEFERYTPAFYIEAAREVLGAIDLDPASCEMAQRTVQATEFLTAQSDPDGLNREWHGRAWQSALFARIGPAVYRQAGR